jgi:hypothetical protein
MGKLARERHEALAQALFQALATGGSATSAYMSVPGYTNNHLSARVNVSRLLKTCAPLIERVRELQAEARKTISVESILGELDEARTVAHEERQPAAMVSASATKAKLAGLMVDKAEVKNVNQFDDIQTSADLAERLLKDVNPSVVITASLRQKAQDEIARHIASLSALANGQDNAENTRLRRH